MTEPDLKLNLPNWLGYIMTITGVTGFAGVILLYACQCKLIYPANYPEGSREEVAVPSDYGMNYIEETLRTRDGVHLKSYIILQPNEDEAKRRPTILYFHANAGNMGHRLPIAKQFYNRYKCNVVMLSYRGYGKSDGSPNEKGLKIDSQTMLDYVREHPILRTTPLVAYGQSIGGAVAIDLVSRNEDSFSGLMLENTFLSMPKVIPHVMPFLKYATFLCHQHWYSEKAIKNIVNTPILFLAGAKDELVPPSHMLRLKELSETRAGKVWASFPNGMHNNTCMQPGYFTAIQNYLSTHILKEELGERSGTGYPTTQQVEPKETEDEATVEAGYVDGQIVGEDKENNQSYQLVSGLADEKGQTHNFTVKEVYLDKDD
ncbi:Alpha/Beta hydrolase protein [Mycotypha africana]|uniref:Alpha/Beta hydrolase protein n=1 Tax=Mycotypha africana TaxID=64632 RepID=UPI002300CAA5|nr:Alpha/Beta hydrolase protein [Mycotypha africana]KAI8979633.1 Alpha/Beta hydrolase protein [Mycotypha africana]